MRGIDSFDRLRESIIILPKYIPRTNYEIVYLCLL